MPTLWPCADCARYIRHHEVTCPFCGAAVTPRALPPDALLERPWRVARSAMVALAAAVATGSLLTACSDRAVPPPPPPQLIAPPTPTEVAAPDEPKPTPTATIEVVASPPQAAQPLPPIPPVAAHAHRQTRQVVNIDDVVDEREIQHINVAPPYGAAPVPTDGALC